MALPKARPMRFTPRGLCDAFDSTERFPGACQQLQNLVFDQSNPEIVVPRPGVVTLELLSILGFANPTFISVHAVIGTRIYGMVATSRNPGQDEPFCIDTLSNTSIPIAGVAAGNTPGSPPNSGDWTPPTIANVGVFVLITHPLFSGLGTNFFGVIDLTNPAVPVWSSANTAVNALPGVPKSVSNFNNRAWFSVANQLFFSDNLAPTTRTNANQELTVGDSTDIVAQSGLPIQTTSSGIVSSLTAFKNAQIWQVTGDAATNNLALNYISLSIGTKAPRTIAQAPTGIYFFSTAGGPYVIDGVGALHPLTHDFNDTTQPDLQVPFQNASTPSRWAGGYIASIYRLCGPTVILGQVVTNDYWFDEHRRRWNGPHSYVYDCVSAFGNSFILSSALNPGRLVQSTIVPGLSPVYTDLGTQLSVWMLSCTFPKTGEMAIKQVVESQIELGGRPLGALYDVTAVDENGVMLGDAGTMVVSNSGANTWGGGTLWGSGIVWTSGQNQAPYTYAVPWSSPLIFEKMALSIRAKSTPNLQIGTFYARYQLTGYMTMKQAV